MKKNQKLFVSRYVPYTKNHKKYNFYMIKLVSITAMICIFLLGTTFIIARQIPKEVFVEILKGNAVAKTNEEKGYLYPMPDDITRAKADRLREIRYEDYLSHCYTPLNGEMDNVYVYDNQKKCYLTFDDGPSNITPKILDILKQYKVHATFFVKGQNAQLYPHIIRQIHKDGHTIGNHSYSHEYGSIYSESKNDFKKEVTLCRDAINNALGESYENLVFRFPGGYSSLRNETTKSLYRDALIELGYKYIDWSCLTGDSNSENPTEADILQTLKFSISNTATGDIVVLLHDATTKQITADTLPKVIEYLYEQGYTFDVLKNQ